MAASAAKFGPHYRLTAKDYLDWFKLDICPKEKVVVEDRSEKAIAISEETDCYEDDPPPLQPYNLHGLGRHYVQKYVEEDIEDQKIFQNQNIRLLIEKNSNLNAMEEDTMTGTLLGAEIRDDKNSIYKHYDFSKYSEKSSKLPVYNWKKEILRKIDAFRVIVIEGETGCGKSTQVPQFILDYGFEELKHVNIVVTQPRKLAAISLANRVCAERGWTVGKLVGYQVGLDNNTDRDTRLTFMTTEVLVQKMIHCKSLDEYTHIILDEVHERDQHTDFALLVAKKLLHTVSRHVKIILMSATIDVAKFAKYFSSPIHDRLIPAPIISITDHTEHSRQIYYLETLTAIRRGDSLPTIDPDNPNISPEMFQLVVDMLKGFDNMERNVENITSPTIFPESRGAVLIFLPGLREIELLIDLLHKGSSTYKWATYPLHSSITLDEQQCVFTKPPAGFRKVILSTNIAESSITVSDIKYVIDFCLTKILTSDPVTNLTSLKLDWASKASCQQRAGRSGRVSSGRVYRLVPTTFYDMLSSYTTPELCRTPLIHAVLKTKLLDMGEPQKLLALAMDPPNMSDICRNILTLKQIGALTMKTNGIVSPIDGDLTFLGKVAANLPLDPHLSKLIVMGYIFGCLRETVIIAAGLSIKSFHARPFQDELNAFVSKVSWAYGSFSDCMAILNTYNVWENLRTRGTFSAKLKDKEYEWARKSYVQIQAIKEVACLVKEISSRLERNKIYPKIEQGSLMSSQALMIKICIAAAFYPMYFTRSISTNYQESICRELNGHDPFSTLVVCGLPTETNILYDSQLRELFYDCSQDLAINYEGSKAYIQFSRHKNPKEKKSSQHLSDIPGEYPTSLHLALKKKQIQRLKYKFSLNRYSNEESKLQMSKILRGDNQSKGSSPHISISQDTINPTSRRADVHSQQLKPAILPGPSNKTWDIHVTHVEDAGRFWGISNNHKTFENLNYIQSAISLCQESNKGIKLSELNAKPGAVCLAPYMDTDGDTNYYRAQIVKILDKNESKAQVHFVDFGNNIVAPLSELQEIPETLLEIPMLAIQCALCEVKPASKILMGESWSEAATTWIIDRILNKAFTLHIYSVVYGVMRVQVLEKASYGNLISINESLIANGFALKSEELLMSKHNHHLRSIYSDEFEASNFVSESLTRAMSHAAIALPKDLPKFSGQIRIKGPFSPLEMNFSALNRASSGKPIRIEGNSVNSTILDPEPQNPHTRMMVSSFMVLNPTETSVCLRSTTLMPGIPGIMPLCLLLFSPMAELRMNKDKTEYIGLICGLGYEEATKHPTYPEEDIETEFDFDFKQEDLVIINKVRLFLNIVLNEGEDITDKLLSTAQKKLRELVMTLLDEKRTYKEPEPYHKPYRWSTIPDELVLCPSVQDSIQYEFEAYPLYCGIDLPPTDSAQFKASRCKKLHELQKRLELEKKGIDFEVKAECIICRYIIETYGDLKYHVYSDDHRSKFDGISILAKQNN